MPIIFRNNGAWGVGKGSKLTSLEADGNFWELLQRVVGLEDAPAEEPITDIDFTGGVMTITVAGGATFSTALPVSVFVPRGTWTHPSHYTFMDVVNVPTLGTYWVLQTHDTQTPFNPDRIIGGNPVYQLLNDAGAAGPTGPAGADGADGAVGPAGPPFRVDAQGSFASRAAFDDEAEGFVFISDDGADGLGGLDVMYIMGGGGSADWTGPFSWGAPQGDTGPEGPTGPAGANGLNFNVNATGLFAGRAAHDDEATGYSYLSTNGDGTGVEPGSLAGIYFKNSGTHADWSARIPFQGPVGATGATGPDGPDGPPGPTGPAGLSYRPDATGPFSTRSTYNTQPAGFSFLSTNGDGGANLEASFYFKASATSGDWGPRIPLQGPKGNTGAAGTNGAAGPAGPQGPPGTTGAPGSTTFIGLTDTPSAFTGKAGRGVRVNAAATAVEFDYPKKKRQTISTTTYTAVASDAGTRLRCTNAAGCTVTVNNGVFADEDELDIIGTLDQVILAGSATALKPADMQAHTRVAGSAMGLYFTGANNYDLTGDLEPV